MKSGRLITIVLSGVSSIILSFAFMMLSYIKSRPSPFSLPYPYTIIQISVNEKDSLSVTRKEVLECFTSTAPIVFFEPAGERMILVHDPSLFYSSTKLLDGRYFFEEEFIEESPVALISTDPFLDDFTNEDGLLLSGNFMRVLGHFVCDYGIVNNVEYFLYVASLSFSDSLLNDWDGTFYFSNAGSDAVQKLEKLFRLKNYNLFSSMTIESKSSENSDRYPLLVYFVIASACSIPASLLFVVIFRGWFARREIRAASRFGANTIIFSLAVFRSHAAWIFAGSALGCLAGCLIWNKVFGTQFTTQYGTAASALIFSAVTNASVLFLGTSLAFRKEARL